MFENKDIENILDDSKFVDHLCDMHDSGYDFTNEMQDAYNTLIHTYTDFLCMEKLADLDIAIVAISNNDYNNKVMAIFNKIKKNLPSGPENHVYLYAQPTKFMTKWVLKGPGAKRPIDFFKVSKQPHQLLRGFHVNIVKFWWDGVKVHALGSGVLAALTGVNMWYNWFSNNKDPMDIVLKYVQRGYTMLLNSREAGVLHRYLSEVNKYKSIHSSFRYGKIHKHHEIFNLNENRCGIRYGFRKYMNQLSYPM